MSVVASGASPLGTSARCDGSGRGSSVAGGDACSCAVSAGVHAGEGDAAAVAAVAPEGGVHEAGVLADVGDGAAVAAVAPEGGVLEAGRESSPK